MSATVLVQENQAASPCYGTEMQNRTGTSSVLDVSPSLPLSDHQSALKPSHGVKNLLRIFIISVLIQTLIGAHIVVHSHIY